METIDEIVADIRAQNQGLPEDGYALSPLVSDLLGIADRIEAAHKREQEDAIAATVVAAAESASEVYEPHIQSEPVGNAAKMREALELMNDLYDKEAICTSYANTPEEMEQIDELYRKTKAALSAPVRNCDLYATEDDAWDAFSSKRQGADSSTEEYEKWLFAEAKGANK
jgi:phosphoenolpyruvate carboxylase